MATHAPLPPTTRSSSTDVGSGASHAWTGAGLLALAVSVTSGIAVVMRVVVP